MPLNVEATGVQLTDILLRRGWVSPAQLDEVAFDDQSNPTVCVESLLQLGYLNRVQALEALGEFFECPSANLAGVTIDPAARALLTGRLAWQLRALPMFFETDGATVAVACLNPQESRLLSSLNDTFGEHPFRLHIALKGQLEPALLDSYRESMTAPQNATASQPTVTTAFDTEPQSRLLIVGPPSKANQYLAQSLAEVYDRVIFVNTAIEALTEVEEQTFAALMINDSVPGEYLGLMRRFRAGSPSGRVRFYSDVRHLATGGESSRHDSAFDSSPWAALVEAVVEAVDEKSGPNVSFAALTDHLGHRLGLPEEQRLRVALAAHLYAIELTQTATAPEAAHFASCDNLASLSRDLELDNILKLVEHDTLRLRADHPSFDHLAADIIAQIAFCLSRWERLDALTFDLFETVKAHLTALAGRRFLPEVVWALIEVLRDGVALAGGVRKNSRVMLLNDRGEDTLMLQPCLENLDFQVTSARTVEQVLPSFQRNRPDMMLILKHGAATEVRNLVDDLTAQGIPVDKLPTFVLAERPALSDLTGLLKAGVEEIMPLDGDLDPLLVKMCRIRSRLEQESSRRLALIQHVGTHGTLEDMNVVDLLQAMGMSDKTVRLSITAHGAHLSMFLDHGHLTFAECDDRIGAEAVFTGLSWTRGVWSVDPVGREDLPEPNNDRSIDSILIEGCCLIDEKLRDEAKSDSLQTQSILIQADD